jgi:hypothetical protein
MSYNDLLSFFDDNKVDYLTEGNHHCREGWVQVNCMFCTGGDSGYHLGINIDGGYGNCYRCGWKSLQAIVSAITGCHRQEAKSLVNRLSRGSKTQIKVFTEPTNKLPFVLPNDNTLNNTNSHAYQYLKTRYHEQVQDVIDMYNLCATNFMYKFKAIKDDKEYESMKYASKIVIPNYYNNEVVSFQTRSYLPHEKSYITAKPNEEIMHHKDFLWGIDNVLTDTIIVCEAPFDAMTIGYGAVHTHGVNVTENQLNELATFKRVYLAFDQDKADIESARKVCSQLSHKTSVAIVKFGRNGEKDINDLIHTAEGRKELQEIKELLQ